MNWKDYLNIFCPDGYQKFTQLEEQVFVLRDDLIHPYVSGNKLRKLWKYLDLAKNEQLDIVTYGGAFSNHLVATAFACNRLNISCKAYVRGEEVKNKTLQKCMDLGMRIEFISRFEYSEIKKKQGVYNKILYIPEGGASNIGIQSVKESFQEDFKDFDAVVLASGTLTTAVGVALRYPNIQVYAVPVLNALGEDLYNDLKINCEFVLEKLENLKFGEPAHLGAYAKINATLIDFMNQFWHEKGIPLDPIYTAKSFFWFYNHQHLFEGKRVLLMHTGGLQGLAGMQTKLLKMNKKFDYYEENMGY